MRHLLNTLYVTMPGSYLSKEGETVVVKVERETKIQVPVANLEGIVCIGGVGFSPPLMKMCSEKGVTLSFLTESGEFLSRVTGPVSGNILLRKEQHRRSDNIQKTIDIAKTFVLGKLLNSRTVLLRAARETDGIETKDALTRCSDCLKNIVRETRHETSLDSIRGKEGQAGHTYFSVFDRLIITQKDNFYFKERSRRPPLDNVNALLSFTYTLLAHDCIGACESVGLDPQSGFLHADRPGRPSLALDIMEELRPFLADRLVLTLINRQQVRPEGFKKTETGAVLMDTGTRKEVLKTYQERKKEELEHPFIEEKVSIGLLPYIQACLFARYLRGDLNAYPPFVWK
jgi:CRISPR-associated protein Cas1